MSPTDATTGTIIADPIIDELHRQRDEQSARFPGNPKAALDDLLATPLPEPFGSRPTQTPPCSNEATSKESAA